MAASFGSASSSRPTTRARFADAGVVFDYGVEFGIEVAALGISTTKPLKVRYRALGFNLAFGDGGGFQPIFDTSKGYELDLGDPGLFKLPSPIDNVLKIMGARIAKVNPLTVELDLGMKVDLGVVTIDRFKVKVPVDPPGVPTILPSGIKVDIAKVLLGSGYVNIIEPPADGPAGQPGFGGIEGAFDVTLVPIKLRIAASFGVRPVTDGQRQATAVFLGLIVDLPAPIPLGQSGIGIYGFSGLFAMHYRRLENDPDPTDAVGPAILWLKRAGGEPAKLFDASSQPLWGPELDRWSFGVGIMLGTVEGGFLVNLRGMFVLELPGPRILVFVKILIVQPLPDLKPATDLTVGILGVIDLDFARRTFTLGIIVDLEIKEIVQVVVPVELFTRLDDLNDWHLYIGTFSQPASAMVLNIVRGFGYFMIDGKAINGWPGYGSTTNLPGIAVAAGIGASVILGDESVGLYLKVSARADVGVSFSPRLFLVGRILLEGELRLFIVSIGAHGQLDVLAPDPTHIHGEVCGHVDFFFFSVEGCVTVDIGPTPPPPPPPALVRNVWLQSHAPVISAGQGGDRPIDASLGDALPGTAGAGPTVPIDAVPVVQFQTAPVVDPAMTTFTTPLAPAPGMRPGGWVPLGGDRRVTYTLTGLRLTGGAAPAPGIPAATWRPDPATSSTGGRTDIDLALLSNVPMMGARALERSSDLDAIIEGIWGDLCTPIAPPTCVLWTFCGQPLGPSGHGWVLADGEAWPDPPGTIRSTPPGTVLRVVEPESPIADALSGILLGHTPIGRLEPARVIGPNGPLDERGDPGDGGDVPRRLPGAAWCRPTCYPTERPTRPTWAMPCASRCSTARAAGRGACAWVAWGRCAARTWASARSWTCSGPPRAWPSPSSRSRSRPASSRSSRTGPSRAGRSRWASPRSPRRSRSRAASWPAWSSRRGRTRRSCWRSASMADGQVSRPRNDPSPRSSSRCRPRWAAPRRTAAAPPPRSARAGWCAAAPWAPLRRVIGEAATRGRPDVLARAPAAGLDQARRQGGAGAGAGAQGRRRRPRGPALDRPADRPHPLRPPVPGREQARPGHRRARRRAAGCRGDGPRQ